MANDLRVQGIGLPNPVVGACPSDVVVEVINAGPDPAVFPQPWSVCLEIRTSADGPADTTLVLETRAETPQLPPGKIRKFIFRNVAFPCALTATVVATADCGMTVPDNDRTAPTLTVQVPKIDAIPWLWTDLRLGLQDSTGFITWSPAALCPGATCIAEITIRNAGCAPSQPSVTELDLADGGGQSIATLTNNTPAIAAGQTIVVRLSTTLPIAVAGQSLTFRACADSTSVVAPQCDRAHLCATRTLQLATAAAPTLTFAATASIFPNDPVPLTWRIQNACADLGKITARISYQAVGIHTGLPMNVGLQDGPKGADPLIDPSVVPPGFYRIGTSRLTLELTGTGTDPGPYTATTDVTVMAEPSAGTWAFTAPPPATAPWKRPYDVAGRLTNPARAAMTPSTVVLNETSTILPAVSRNATLPFTPLVTAAARTDIWPLLQGWSWVVPGIWVLTGPFSGTFTYTYTFAASDQFGNAYPAATSSAATVTVSVSGLKIGLATAALVMFGVALGLVVAGILAAAGYITAVGAPILFTLAGIAFGIASALGLGALDPPVPNFDYRRSESVVVAEIPAGLTDDPGVARLVAIFALMSRIAALEAAIGATEARLTAARIDRDIDASDQRMAEYRGLRDSLVLAARSIPLAVVEANEAIQSDSAIRPTRDVRTLRRGWRTLQSDGISAKDRRAWAADGLEAEHIRLLTLALSTPEVVVRPLDDLLADLPQAVAQIAAGIQEEADRVLIIQP